MEEIFKKLKLHYGNHSEAARQIGITPRYYRGIRSGRITPGTLLKNHIKELSEKFDFSTRQDEDNQEENEQSA